MLSLTLLLSLISQMTAGESESVPNTYTIGVLAKRGEQIAIKRWAATADYLTKQIPEAQFRIAPLQFKQVESAIREKRIDFLLANSGIYIEVEHNYGAFRIATLINKGGGHTVNRFGAVIFTRRDNHSLRTLSDLKNLTFAAVSQNSLGGFLMARRELIEQGIDTEEDFSLRFLGTHDAVVEAVLTGQVDAGTVRTDTLERMSASGLISLDRIKVLNKKSIEEFPYRLSSRLYPEWPMAALPHTLKSLNEKISIALLNLSPDHPAILSSGIYGWTVPANYKPVHELYDALNIPPHHRPPPTLIEWSHYHPITVIATLASLLLIVASLILLTRYNRRLQRTKNHLSLTIEQLQATKSQLKDNLSQLKQSENKFSQLAESALDAIIMLNPDGKIELWNPAASTIFGYTQEEAKQLHISQWLSDDLKQNPDGEQHANQIMRYIGNSESPPPSSLLELQAIRKSGEIFPIEASISSVFLQKGWFVICLIRDITQRKVIEAEREQMTLQLTQNHKMTALAQLADGIAHEINTPIQAINNNLAFLQDAYQDSRELVSTFLEFASTIDAPSQHSDKYAICEEKYEDTDLGFLDEEVAATVEQSRQSTEQVSRIIRSMRIFTTSDCSTYEKIDLNKLIDDVLRISRYQWEPIAELETDLDDNLPLVTCAPSELHQAMINVVMNAVQAVEDSPKDISGKITIASQRTGNQVLIEISDNGNGIPEAAQEHIFNPFFTTREVGKGTGQGLTLCHDIVVRKHSGTLEFTTKAGEGTTFYIKLPIDSATKKPEIEKVEDNS